MVNKADRYHIPYFANKTNPRSITKQAYCSMCDALIKYYGQSKCDRCGIVLHWNTSMKEVEE